MTATRNTYDPAADSVGSYYAAIEAKRLRGDAVPLDYAENDTDEPYDRCPLCLSAIAGLVGGVVIAARNGRGIRNQGGDEMADVTSTAGHEEPTLRDFFAAKALPTLIDIGHDEGWSVGETAEAAYQYADAMMAVRGGP